MGVIFGSELSELIRKLLEENNNFTNVKTVDELISKLDEFCDEEFEIDLGI